MKQIFLISPALLLSSFLTPLSIPAAAQDCGHCTHCTCQSNPPEKGLEHGVSAAFAGTVNGIPVFAGGCNFPYADPLAPDLKKVFYQGIYNALTGERLGDLPAATAYGASVTTPYGLAMIGGEKLKSAWLLTLGDDGKAVVAPLPDLPFTLDNSYGALVGSEVFVAGGNADGIPSNTMISLDLANPEKGWQKRTDFPGNPRTQPVLAEAGGKLYLFGGFAARHNGIEPTLNCDGWEYDPAADSYSPLPAPVIDGNELSLGGGIAANIDGKIVCTGGVNKDIFINALRQTPEGYLQHPKEWYRFNGTVCIFDPATGTWTIGESSPQYARAGAATALINSGRTILLIGGELKPRVRTPETATINP